MYLQVARKTLDIVDFFRIMMTCTAMPDNLSLTPSGFSQLNKQNQAAIVSLIQDVVLKFQKDGSSGRVELRFASGGCITEISPTPTIKVSGAQ